MSDDHLHLRLSREFWSAIAEGDADAVAEMLAPEVVWRSAGRNALAGEYRGVAAVLDYLARIGERADEWRSSPSSFFVNDEGAAIVYHVSAARAGRRLRMDYILILRIDDGRITSGLSVPVDQHTNDEFWS